MSTTLQPVPRRSAPRVAIPIDLTDVEHHDGVPVVEVTASYRGTVLDVQHVGQVKPRNASAPLLLGLGGAAVLAGGVSFLHDASAAFVDWAVHDAAVAQAYDDDPTGRTIPVGPAGVWGTGDLGLALVFLGLLSFAAGVVRSGDRGVRRYTIGEAHGVTFHAPTDGLPDPTSFALVDEDRTLHFTEAMTGEVIEGDHALTLAELVRRGRARALGGAAHALPLLPGTRARVHTGGLTFHVAAVAPGRVVARASEPDKPFWIYNAASCMALGSLLVLMQLVPDPEEIPSAFEGLSENRFVGYMNEPDAVRLTTNPWNEGVDVPTGGTGQRDTTEEGRMGKPSAKPRSGLYAMKGPKDAVPYLARSFDPLERARGGGILGVLTIDEAHFLPSMVGGTFAVGNDDEDMWGGLVGTEIGESFGVGGLSVAGFGRGTGGTAEGTIGLGNVGLVRGAGGAGKDSGYGSGAWAGFRDRSQRRPQVHVSRSYACRGCQAGFDREIIRRVVRSHINEVRHCYNEGLVRDPNLRGRVAIQFSLGHTGKVLAAVVESSSLADSSVANCVAKVVRRWSFPTAAPGGTALITYPFVLSPG